jgi:hypothetical protein
MTADLVLLTPLKAESEPLLALLGDPDGPALALPEPACVRPYRVGARRVLAGWTGIGAAATTRAVEELTKTRPLALLHLGVAGGLAPALRAGDVVVCDRVLVDGRGDEAIACAPEGPLSDWLARVVAAARGAALTVEHVVPSAEAKRALFERTGAQVVEMESFWAARAARAAGLPIACLRAVIDRQDESLPDLTSALDQVGRPRTLRLLRHLVARPGTIAALPRVARSFGVAQEALGRVGRDVLAALRG